jgi:N-acetylmuramidase
MQNQRRPARAVGCRDVDTSGKGFPPDRRPEILFDRHIFSKRTSVLFDATTPEISARRPADMAVGGPANTLDWPRRSKFTAKPHSSRGRRQRPIPGDIGCRTRRGPNDSRLRCSRRSACEVAAPGRPRSGHLPISATHIVIAGTVRQGQALTGSNLAKACNNLEDLIAVLLRQRVERGWMLSDFARHRARSRMKTSELSKNQRGSPCRKPRAVKEP